MESFPVIDISRIGLLSSTVQDEDYKSIGEDFYKSLSEFGCVYLKNSGIKEEYANEVQEKYEQFFQLNVEEKEKFNFGQDGTGTGYTGVGEEYINEYGNQKEYKESFDIDGDIISGFSKVVLPDEKVDGFTKSTFQFAHDFAQLAHRVCNLLSYGLKLKDVNALSDRHSLLNKQGNHSTLRSYRYPPITEKLKQQLEFRIGAHSDYGSFTLIFQDSNGGLQAKHGDKFVDVPYIPDTIVMTVANVMNIWSNGRLVPSTHKVGIPSDSAHYGKQRRSLAYYVFPDDKSPMDHLECEGGADAPRPDRLMFRLDEKDAPKTAIEWINKKLQALQHAEKFTVE